MVLIFVGEALPLKTLYLGSLISLRGGTVLMLGVVIIINKIHKFILFTSTGALRQGSLNDTPKRLVLAT